MNESVFNKINKDTLETKGCYEDGYLKNISFLLNKSIYYEYDLQRHLLNSKWSFNFHSRDMFELLRKFEDVDMFLYLNFRRETMEVSQSIKMSVENRKKA